MLYFTASELPTILFVIMDENQHFCSYSGLVDEVYGLTDYESFYYDAPQQPSYNWSELFYCQTEFVYDPAFYVIPSYQVYYPMIPVAYSADYYNQTYGPVFSGYYMPFYYLPSNLYYISDMYPGQVFESSSVSSSAEQNSFIYEEFDSSLYNTAFGFSEKSYESFTDGVGEVTCYLYQEERPEKMNDDPNDDEENTNSSNNRVNNALVPSTPDTQESTAVQIDDGGQPCSPNTNPCDDVSFLKSLSDADFNELKAEIDGTYNHLKENLYKDVTKGYTRMKEFLKNVKWKWDRCLYTIREEEKVKKSFDMDFEYYFHDVIRIPKGRVRYEDAAEKYILYQMLGSLEMPLLKEFMELNYDKHKKRIYKKECKGHTKIKKQLKKLKWKRSKLYPITDGDELKITEKGFVKNFIRGLRNITSEKSKDVHYLLDVLKKSVLTSTPESEEGEEVQDVFTEEGIDPDCELMKEHPQLSVSSADSKEGEIPNKPDITLSTDELDVESQNVSEDLQLVEYSSCVAEDSEIDPVPHKTESSFSKEDFGVEIIEETNSATSSPKKEEVKECPFAPSEIEIDSTSEVSFREEELHAVLRSSTEETNLDASFPDGVEEMKFPPPPDILGQEALAAASEKCHQKKRFSSLRKFLSRICCCRKKPPS